MNPHETPRKADETFVSVDETPRKRDETSVHLHETRRLV
jgi:hypothetical protein